MLYPVILSGGSGTRLWPLSRALHPKQLLPLLGARTMLQQTILRLQDSQLFAAPLIICNDQHKFLIADQLRAIDVKSRGIVLEPQGRNTAPAAAAAAIMLEKTDPNAILIVLPSDHVILDPRDFVAAAEAAASVAKTGALVTFGVKPTKAETGYGYIQCGSAFDGKTRAYHVKQFVEKPSDETAAGMLRDGNWLWNCGIFVFTARDFLSELDEHYPGVVSACRQAINRGKADLDFFRLDAESFERSPNESVDYALMERTKNIAVVPCDFGWSDVGSWSALWELGEKDSSGNVLLGDVEIYDVQNSYIRSDAGLLTVVGVKDLVAVATSDAVLVSSKAKSQDVKLIVERLISANRAEQEHHSRVYRPWGYFQSVAIGQDYQVKKLSVKPGAKLSLQAHAHRAEHWIVVQGRAKVTRDDDVFELGVNQSVHIPVGARHRLENPSNEELMVIEVQSGDYLGEDDIIRFDDVYNRIDK